MIDALVVFSLSIKYMKDKAVEILRERTGNENYSAKDVQWVLTVPAIWTPAAKQFMREAAYEVGCKPFNVMVMVKKKKAVSKQPY